MQNNPYGAYAAHTPAPFPAVIRPGIFNLWGISGYTGSVNTEEGLDAEKTYCSLAKIQQSMTGHNQFDPSAFTRAIPEKTVAPTNEDEEGPDSDPDSDSDSNSDDDDDSAIDRPDTPPPRTFNYATYCPAPPGSYTPKESKRAKKERTKKAREDNKCKSCDSTSGFPVKKIKKLKGELWCWACIWKRYNHAAQKVWEESEDVKSDC